jgi:hypothetical protein
MRREEGGRRQEGQRGAAGVTAGARAAAGATGAVRSREHAHVGDVGAEGPGLHGHQQAGQEAVRGGVPAPVPPARQAALAAARAARAQVTRCATQAGWAAQACPGRARRRPRWRQCRPQRHTTPLLPRRAPSAGPGLTSLPRPSCCAWPPPPAPRAPPPFGPPWWDERVDGQSEGARGRGGAAARAGPALPGPARPSPAHSASAAARACSLGSAPPAASSERNWG